MRRQIDYFLPWLTLEHAEGAPDETDWKRLGLHGRLPLSELPRACEAALAALPDLASTSPEREPWLARMRSALERGADHARRLHDDLYALTERVDAEIERMDFSLLFDRDRKLFHIGYDATADRLDPNHYDLLASEARLASYLAIVKKDAPETHWYVLGRPLARVAGAPTLRVVVTRATLNATTRGPKERAHGEDDQLIEAAGAVESAEVAYFRLHYEAHVKAALPEALAALSSRDRLYLRQHYLDQLTLDEMARLHAVHIATVKRHLAAARGELTQRLEALLCERLNLSPSELKSVLAMVQSRLHVTMRRLLPDGAGEAG
jgi:DNA-directed RNA polymerase specialized sigma24 family protein